METDCGNVTTPVTKGATWAYEGCGTGGSYTGTGKITGVGATALVVETKLPDVSFAETWACEQSPGSTRGPERRSDSSRACRIPPLVVTRLVRRQGD
jgi:hypothetical protein